MKRTTITLAAIAAALVPAFAGLWGNATFSQAVPVRVPASAQVVAPAAVTSVPTASRTTEVGDDHGGITPRDARTEPGDDRATQGGTTVTRTPEVGDDHGGITPRDARTEPGDDRNAAPSGSTSGSASSGSTSSGAHGSGSDDSGSDDHGGGGGHH
jgi:hypothetical protein